MQNTTSNKWLYLGAVALLLTCAGCKSKPRLEYLQDRVQPVPAADLPVHQRVENWIGVNARHPRGGGSCMWASLWNCVRVANRPDIEQVLAQQKRSGYQGPETLSGMARKLDAIGVPWAATEDGDVALLEAATLSNRWAVITYYTGHAVNFCGFAKLNRYDVQALQTYASANGFQIVGAPSQLYGREVAILLDNNRPQSYIVVEPRERFIWNWQNYYHGVAIVPWLNRTVPRTYPRTRNAG